MSNYEGGIRVLPIPLTDTYPSILNFDVAYTSETVHIAINSTKSPASGANNVSEPRLMSQVGRVREFMCA